jgi:protein-disulfide isomerase
VRQEIVMHTFVRLSLFVAALAALPACQRQDKETREKLDLILGKVDALDKKVAALAGRPAGAQPAMQQPQRKRPDPATTYYVPVSPETDAIKGPKTAKVTIVEAFEFACPYCAMLHEPMTEVAKQNPDVRIVGKQYVVHPDTATLPALAVCAANKQGKYAQFEDALWEKAWPMEGDRPNFKREYLAADKLEEIAKGVGLDVNRFKADRDGAECKATLERWRNELAAIGVSGTPAVYINGKPYQGPRTPEAIGAAIAEARNAADEVIGGGKATAESYYDTLMKSAQKAL